MALLFSGGVDCSLLAALVHRALPAGEPIELVNVAFEQPRKGGNNKGKGKEVAVDTYATPDRASGLAAADELRASCPGREWRFVAVDVPLDESRAHRQAVVDLMYPSKTGESNAPTTLEVVGSEGIA